MHLNNVRWFWFVTMLHTPLPRESLMSSSQQYIGLIFALPRRLSTGWQGCQRCVCKNVSSAVGLQKLCTQMQVRSYYKTNCMSPADPKHLNLLKVNRKAGYSSSRKSKSSNTPLSTARNCNHNLETFYSKVNCKTPPDRKLVSPSWDHLLV